MVVSGRGALGGVCPADCPSPPQECLCSPHHVLEEEGLPRLAATVRALLERGRPTDRSGPWESGWP